MARNTAKCGNEPLTPEERKKRQKEKLVTYPGNPDDILHSSYGNVTYRPWCELECKRYNSNPNIPRKFRRKVVVTGRRPLRVAISK